MVGIDYFTKWVEAIPLSDVTHEVVIEFIQKYIIHRFGMKGFKRGFSKFYNPLSGTNPIETNLD